MVFSDPVFMYLFLPTCLAVYWAGGWRIRNPFLVLIGGVFYVTGGGAFALLLAATILVNHFAALTLTQWRQTRPRDGRMLLAVVIILDAASLGVWKYGGFAAAQAARLMRALGFDATWTVNLVLPIAISFYTFQCISYVVDVWHAKALPARRLVDFAAYILLFPHLIAGPIVRYADIEADLIAVPRNRANDFAIGAPRFFWGLGKKVIIADQVAAIANTAFGMPNHDITSGVAWIGSVAFAVQIYFDFSGYSDMAIGLARMFGFHFPENFDRPYSALSLTDFWRRWHMSLSSWFRDYVYIPLGGNRRGVVRTYVNLGIVFLLTGLWHGANWTFLLWGCFHGAGLIVERLTGLGVTESTRWNLPRRLATFALVCLGWAMFRAGSLEQGVTFMRAMLVPGHAAIPFHLRQFLTTQRLVWMGIGLATAMLPASIRFGTRISEADDRWSRSLRFAAVGLIAPMACVYTLSSTFSPFLYFKF